MLNENQIEQMFVEFRIPEAGRALVRQIRSGEPVRKVSGSMDCVRSRIISKKMERALYAESRTVELPAIKLHEVNTSNYEIWPQPCTADMEYVGPKGGQTRNQHTPDLLLIGEGGFEIEEWREEVRLQKYAFDRPLQFRKDEKGIWHYVPAEEYFAKLGLVYKLRSADELPRVYFANIKFLEDYSLASTPLIPTPEEKRLVKLLEEHKRVNYFDLINESKFCADHIFQAVLSGAVYVDLESINLSVTSELVIYANKTIARADALLRAEAKHPLPPSALHIHQGARFMYDGKTYVVDLAGNTEVICHFEGDPDSVKQPLPLKLVQELFNCQAIDQVSTVDHHEFDLSRPIFDAKGLQTALSRFDAIQSGCTENFSVRTIQRWKEKMSGLTDVQSCLSALKPERGGNSISRLPEDAIKFAHESLKFHNQPNNPKISATFSEYITLCKAANVKAMSQSSFYEWIKRHEVQLKREGKRKVYQKAPIPLTFDYGDPVHGVLPHEVVYIDHTILNIFLKGKNGQDLGKPVLTIAVDGALSKVRSFVLWFRNASVDSVLMLLRDYVIRNNCLPRIIVLDNGKEFHSAALKLICSLFKIEIRWRRRSKPRDSTLVERALGTTEQEIISALKGNTLALKDPRMVSSNVYPSKFITWSLPALYGSLESYFFSVLPARVHHRFGISIDDMEKKLNFEYGTRSHRLVRYDAAFKLLTASLPKKPIRTIDRQRGVLVDGCFYWNDRLADAKKGEKVEVRVELWNAGVVYLCFRDEWVLAQARDGRKLVGRFRMEFELQRREERKQAKAAAQADKRGSENAKRRVDCWSYPDQWDAKIREQFTEAFVIYQARDMTSSLPAAVNQYGAEVSYVVPRVKVPSSESVSSAEDIEFSDEPMDEISSSFAIKKSNLTSQVNSESSEEEVYESF